MCVCQAPDVCCGRHVTQAGTAVSGCSEVRIWRKPEPRRGRTYMPELVPSWVSTQVLTCVWMLVRAHTGPPGHTYEARRYTRYVYQARRGLAFPDTVPDAEAEFDKLGTICFLVGRI